MKTKLFNVLTVMAIGMLLAFFVMSCSAKTVCKTYNGVKKSHSYKRSH